MTNNADLRVPQRPANDGKVIRLSSRDVEDARRLLSLLATNDERITIEPPTRSPGAVSADKQALLTIAKALIVNRRRRHKLFGKAMFGEPAWDMLLLLYVLDAGGRQTVGGLSDLAGATRTTGLRWIEYLERQQLIWRNEHPTDRRAAFLQLTGKGRDAIELYLSETVAPAA